MGAALGAAEAVGGAKAAGGASGALDAVGSFLGKHKDKAKSAAGSLGSAVKNFGSVGSAATGAIVGAGVGAVSGVASAGVGAAADQVKGALKTSSMFLIILGIIHYLIRLKLGLGNSFSLYFGFVLMIIAAYAVANKMDVKRKITVFPIIAFLVWYIAFGGSLDPSFLIRYGIAWILIFSALGVLTSGESITPFLSGFIPVAVFFADIGGISVAITQLGLTPTSLMSSLVLFMPWWFFFGIFTLPEEGDSNALIEIVRIIGILYLIFVFMVPFVPAMGYENSIPSYDEFQSAEQEIRDQLPDTENPAYSNLVCTIEMVKSITDENQFDIDECVKERQLNSEIKSLCTKLEGFEEGSSDYESCVEDEKEERAEDEQNIDVAGTVDNSLVEHTDACFDLEMDSFPSKRTVRPSSVSSLQYPIIFEVDNPKEQLIYVYLTCNFTNTKTKESFLGEISNPEIIVESDSESIVKSCSIPDGQGMNGTYKLTYEAEMSGLETISYLTRVLVSEEMVDSEIIEEAEAAYLSGSDSYSSAADEFARINFAFGSPETNPVIEVKDEDISDSEIMLVSTIENVGNGKIISVDAFYIGVEEDFTIEDYNCIVGNSGSVIIPEDNSKGDTETLSLCFINPTANVIEEVNLQDFVVQSYKANLLYSYLISTQNNIEVVIYNE
ncbi:hypothetical protein HN385_06835 [archaeon]|mgnify:CR=1 FL=1|jgi:hypothetical protein|nr:hypothetical protein [archaeon]MBT3451083.1 hypothetical protein [archaeon]MBT6869180.1 hypothetical protein [archaeon]MBT7193716.1 hypothetical protein [archaeon]MBT7381363.1 hypothetical protein [archaeon]